MNPYLLSFICLGLIFASTVIGASFTLFFKKSFGPKISSIVLGFSGGVMVSSAVFGLLLPSMEQASSTFGNYSLLVVCGSFLAGCLLLFALDKLIPHMHPDGRKEGPETSRVKPSTKLFLAVTLHNIPEGIAVGLACGIYFASPDQWPIALAAITLALGIAIQNIPEGAAVSLPTALASFAMTSLFICLLCMQKVSKANAVAVVGAILGVSLCKCVGLSGPAILIGALVGVGCALLFSLKTGESDDSAIKVGD